MEGGKEMSNVNMLQANSNIMQLNNQLNLTQQNLTKIDNRVNTTINKTTNQMINHFSKVNNKYNTKNKNISKFNNNKIKGSISLNFNKVNNIAPPSADGGGSKGGFDLAGSLGTVSKMANVADSYINTSARLGMVNDGTQTNGVLQDKVFQTAQKSGVSYQSTADMMSKMALAPGFNSNNEALSFTELAQKSMKIGGGSEANREAATNTLTDAMSSGGLSGEGFGNILQNAPMIAEAMASYTGKTNEELQSMAEQGLITSDVIKNAMFASSEAIESKFQDAPKTFQDVWTQISNVAVKSLLPLLDIITEVMNSDGFSQLIDNICVGIDLVAGAILWVVETIQTYWDFFGPLIAGMTIAVAILAIQWMAVCWPIIVIGALIGLLIGAIQSCGVTFRDMFGFIFGAFAVLKAVFSNVFGGMYAKAKDVFNSIFSGVKKVLGHIVSLGNGLLKLLGLEDVYQNAKQDGLNAYDESKEKVSGEDDNLDIPIPDLNSPEYNNFGGGIPQGGGGMPSMPSSSPQMPAAASTPSSNSKSNSCKCCCNGNGGSGGSSVENNKNTKNSSSINMSSANQDIVRDLSMNRYIEQSATTTTLAPNINIVFEGSGNTSNDDKLAKRISKILTEQIAMVAEGVY